MEERLEKSRQPKTKEATNDEIYEDEIPSMVQKTEEWKLMSHDNQ